MKGCFVIIRFSVTTVTAGTTPSAPEPIMTSSRVTWQSSTAAVYELSPVTVTGRHLLCICECHDVNRLSRVSTHRSFHAACYHGVKRSDTGLQWRYRLSSFLCVYRRGLDHAIKTKRLFYYSHLCVQLQMEQCCHNICWYHVLGTCTSYLPRFHSVFALVSGFFTAYTSAV